VTHVKPAAAQLAAAKDLALADVVAPGLHVLFCGINPGLYSAAIGRHFGRPGNRFWPGLHRGGFTPRQLDPAEQDELLTYRLGITNVVGRASARAGELSRTELVAGGQVLVHKVGELQPRWLAVLGVMAWRSAFNRPGATVGPQPETIGGTRVWVLPNPSGLNAHYSLAALAAEFSALRAAAVP
jgi:TDG/mug DNA glycosylase family protein